MLNRQSGSFVAEDDFVTPTVEEKTIGGEVHKLLVVPFPGNYKDYTYLNVEFNDNVGEISKSVAIPLDTLIATEYDGVDPALAFGRLAGETFDWVMEDSREQEDANKRELRVTLAYDEATDTSYVKFHQEPVANEATAAIYLFIAYFIKESVSALKGDPGIQGEKGEVGPAGSTRTADSKKYGIFRHPDIDLSRTTSVINIDFESVVNSIVDDDSNYVQAQDDITGDTGLLAGTYEAEDIEVDGTTYSALKLTLKDAIKDHTNITFNSGSTSSAQGNSSFNQIPGSQLYLATVDNNQSYDLNFTNVQTSSDTFLKVTTDGDKVIYIYQEGNLNMYLWEVNAVDYEGGDWSFRG